MKCGVNFVQPTVRRELTTMHLDVLCCRQLGEDYTYGCIETVCDGIATREQEGEKL